MLTTVAVVFILYIFEPFQFSMDAPGQYKVLLWFASITAIETSLFFVFLPKLFKQFYQPDGWTIGKACLNYLFLIVLMGLTVTCLNYFVFMNPNRPANYLPVFLTDMFAAFTIGIIPISIDTLLIQNRALKRHLREAKEINQYLAQRDKPDNTGHNLITLSGSTKDIITAQPADILYIEATGNYVNVHYRLDGKATYKLLRTTIRQVEEALQDHPAFIRCHRTFIVNTSQIHTVTGNAQGYKLALYDTAQEVPVSRTYLNAFKNIWH